MVLNGEVAGEGIARVVNTRRPRPIGSMWKGVSLLLPFLAAVQAQQQIGVDICSCAPGTYQFTLDFSLSCPPVNITLGDAVTDTSCMISPFGDPTVSDLVPVAVNSIDILELDQNLQISVQENIAGSFGDGDTFQYISSAAVPGEIVDPTAIPRAIQLNIIGVNQFDQPIINVYLIIFSNNCGRYPVLFEGQYAGWTRFTDLQPPLPGLCPASVTVVPTISPNLPPTPPPTVPPTTPSTPSPTPPPTPPPTSLPTAMSMSMSMSMSMDLNMDLLDIISEIEASEFGRSTKTKIVDPARKKSESKGGQSSNSSVDTGKGSKTSDSVKLVGGNKGDKKGSSSVKTSEGKHEKTQSKSSKSSKVGSSDEELKTKVYSSKKESIVDDAIKNTKGSKQSKRRRI